jgi:hypothetical protein
MLSKLLDVTMGRVVGVELSKAMVEQAACDRAGTREFLQRRARTRHGCRLMDARRVGAQR